MNAPELTASLIRAIDSLDASAASAILSRCPDLADASAATEFGKAQTLLHRSIPGDGEPLLDAHIAIVQLLLDSGADPKAAGWGANNGNCAPITMAAWGGHVAIVRLLIDRGANPNGCAEQVAAGNRPIDTAARHGHTAAVEALIEGGAEFGFEHLLMAGLSDRVEQVLAINPEAAWRALPNRTKPLHTALNTRQGAALIGLLLDRGANANARDSRGRTPLHAAIELDLPRAARLLLTRGAEVDAFAAAGLGDSAKLASLLGQDGGEALRRDPDGTTALHFAAWSGSSKCAHLLLEAGAEVSPRSERFWACLTPLHIGLQRGHRDVATLLVEGGADLEVCGDQPGRYWPTPLHAAARWGAFEGVTLLLRAGANPNGGGPVRDSMDSGVVGWLALSGSPEMANLLMAFGLKRDAARARVALEKCGVISSPVRDKAPGGSDS